MPRSRTRRIKTPNSTMRRADAPRNGNGYRPGNIDLDATKVLEYLAGMPADDLPTMGLTYWYLLANPQRIANQCLLASTVLTVVMSGFGIKAEPVVLTLDVANGRGGTTRYGNESPHFDGDYFVGHVGLITDNGMLIDPTAGQFPEIRSGGYRPVFGRLGAETGQALDQGARATVRLQDGTVVTYRSYPRGSADRWVTHLIDSEADKLALIGNNTMLGFVAAMDGLGPERVASIQASSYPQFAARVAALDGRKIELGADDVFRVVNLT